MFRFIALIALVCVAVTALEDGQECSSMQPFCTRDDQSFAAADGIVVQNDPTDNTYYGCLASYPNPSWFYMEIATGGDMIIEMFNDLNLDIDYGMWGPFNDLEDAINRCKSYTEADMVDCSYAAASVETANLNNAQVGEVYVILITNYADQPNMNIFFQKQDNSGTAESSCASLECTGTLSQSGAEADCGTLFAGETCQATCESGYEYVSGDMTWYCDGGDWRAFTGVCQMMDACENNDCPMYSDCNAIDSFTYECVCWENYVMENDICVERDMCLDFPCDPNANCYNVDQSDDYWCECFEGYEGDGYFCELPAPPPEEDCEEEPEPTSTRRTSTNIINIKFADIFAGYDGYISADDDCCDCGCDCGCGCC